MYAIKQFANKVGLPRLIITVFFILLWIMTVILGLPTLTLISDVIRRFGMFGVLALAMVPSIQAGTKPNFGLPIGITCGLLGILIAIEFGFYEFRCFMVAVLVAIPLAVIAGWIYGMLLNKIKGSEMLVATYTGFSIVSFMCIMWIVLPFGHDSMVWPIGKGLRVTISLEDFFAQILNDFWRFPIGKVEIPTGLLLTFFGACLIVWLFSRSKLGLTMKAAGDNSKFALASGIEVDKRRIYGTILSTVLGAIGIIVYVQSYGFFSLYEAPLMMALPAVAAVLIGGASTSKIKISHVIIGTFLFQGLLTIALPVASSIFPEGNISEPLRMIVQNGIIIYALTRVGGEN